MSAETTTPTPETHPHHHDAPPLPTPKRTKLSDPAPNLSVASILNDPMASALHPQQLPSMPSLSFEPPPPPLQVKLLAETARVPTRGSAVAAGYDLYASQAAVIPAGGRGLVETGVSVAVPAGTYGRVAPRSGLASKFGIDVGAGVVDADFRGMVKVLLFNFGDEEFRVAVGERVAQLVVERIFTPQVVVVEELEETVRGAGGFGSTGGFGGGLPGINGPASTGAAPGASAPPA